MYVSAVSWNPKKGQVSSDVECINHSCYLTIKEPSGKLCIEFHTIADLETWCFRVLGQCQNLRLPFGDCQSDDQVPAEIGGES